MVGRRHKPTAFKALMGNPGHRPLNTNELEPKGEVIVPRFLKARLKRLWNEYAPLLIGCGVMKSADVHTFATWCSLAAEFEADAKSVASSRIAQMRALAASLGLDPSSRSRLNVKAPSTGELDRAAQYFAWCESEAKGLQ